MRETPKRSEPVGISPEEALKLLDGERDTGEKQREFEGVVSSFKRGKIPALIMGKIPSGTTYRGYTERDARCEPFREWHVNGYSEEWEQSPYGHKRSDSKNPLIIEIGKLREGTFPRQKEREDFERLISKK